jgi:ankyrin repeat protein
MPRPWQQTALARAVVGDLAATPFSPPPPPPPSPPRTAAAKRDEHHSAGADRTRVLLALGADPNERLHTDGADWTPLALAIRVDGADLVEMLLGYGANVNARWCAPFDFSRGAQAVAPAGCGIDSGTTPRMSAAMRGDADIVALLLSRGGDRTLTDWRQHTAQWYAREAGFKQLAATLH